MSGIKECTLRARSTHERFQRRLDWFQIVKTRELKCGLKCAVFKNGIETRHHYAMGKHDFDTLRQLVFPSGKVLRAELPGRPTRDCLFTDVTRDGVTALKVWNKNKRGGVVGCFNIQGSCWQGYPGPRSTHPTTESTVTPPPSTPPPSTRYTAVSKAMGLSHHQCLTAQNINHAYTSSFYARQSPVEGVNECDWTRERFAECD